MQDPTDCSIISYLRFIKSNGAVYKQSKWNSENKLMDTFNHKLPKAIEKKLDKLSIGDQYKVYPRSGLSGIWNELIYIAFLDKKLSRSINGYTPSLGVYPIIMASPDCQNFYLMYMVAAGSKTPRELTKYVSEVQQLLELDDYATDVSKLNLGKDVKKYKLATICYIELDVDNYVSDSEFIADLQRFLLSIQHF